MASLEGWNFTIKLCPRGIKLPRRGSNANSFFGKSLNHCQFSVRFVFQSEVHGSGDGVRT
jgi:hypothetical protein